MRVGSCGVGSCSLGLFQRDNRFLEIVEVDRPAVAQQDVENDSFGRGGSPRSAVPDDAVPAVGEFGEKDFEGFSRQLADVDIRIVSDVDVVRRIFLLKFSAPKQPWVLPLV